MGYFRELPNLLYPSFLPNKKSSLDYIRVKNVFRRVKVRDDLYNNFVIFEAGQSIVVYKRLYNEQGLIDEEIYITNIDYDKNGRSIRFLANGRGW